VRGGGCVCVVCVWCVSVVHMWFAVYVYGMCVVWNVCVWSGVCVCVCGTCEACMCVWSVRPFVNGLSMVTAV